MKVSINTVRQLIDFDLPPVDELMALVNAQLGGVEEVIEYGKEYDGATIVKVVSCEDHPNADRLHICRVDDGGANKDAQRGEDGLVQVVCGAPNVHANMYAVWLPPKATVPATASDAEPFVLDVREIRGQVSNGMLASLKELAISDNHEGITDLQSTDLPLSLQGRTLQELVGEPFARVFGLNDTVFDIENKMFTHRPDCFGVLGVAREIAGIQQKAFKSPDWYTEVPEFPRLQGDPLHVEVSNNATEKVPRFMAMALSGAEVKPSPLWLQIELKLLGGKSINNIVDATNYVMLLTGQPLHAYDYDKLRGHKLGVRLSKKGEMAQLLNGKTYTLEDGEIVIVDSEGIVGLGGIMGGGNSEVSAETKNIVLEAATFDMYTIRKTSMRHGLFTDAVTRFNKGQSPLQVSSAMRLAIASITDTAGGQVASDVFDEKDDASVAPKKPVEVTKTFINERLGLNLAANNMKALLENVECTVDVWDDSLKVHLPFWRMDVEDPEDVVEEVGRLYGFDKLPQELPKRTISAPRLHSMYELKQSLRKALSSFGANEALTYSFVHEKTLQKAGQDKQKAFSLTNALSPELQYYRLSVLPSLLEKVHPNIKAGHNEFVLFEIGRGHSKDTMDEDGLPAEVPMLDAVYASKQEKSGAAYYHMRKQVSQLAIKLGFSVRFAPVKNQDSITAPFAPGRSATIVSSKGEVLGIVGELKQSVLKAFKLPTYTAALSLNLVEVEDALAKTQITYAPLSKFPSVSRDISIEVPAETTYEAAFDTVFKALLADMTLSVTLSPLSIYQDSKNKAKKTITLRLKLTSQDKTLSGEEVAEIVTAIGNVAQQSIQAKIV